MKYTVMENIGAKPSLLGFGCMRFPLKDGQIDEARSQAMIDLAYEKGVRYYDTAYPYHDGKSEAFTGKALKKYDRESLYIATKLPLWLVESKADALRIFNEQLERLQTDYIDFYLFHAFNRTRFEEAKKLELIPLFEQLQREGKIKHLGFSFHDDYEAFEQIITYRKWDFCQLQLNYMDVDIQAGMKGYGLCEQLGVPIVVMEPVKGGNLAMLPDDLQQQLKAVRPDKSVASWAIRWCGSLPGIKVILSGMSDEAQVADNLGTMESFEPLAANELAVLGDVIRTIRSRVKNGCTGCRYCMPCPFGVDIPRNFAIWNEYGMYPNKERAQHKYANELKEDARAANCRQCGKCEKECPQALHIREDLARVVQDLA